MDESGEHVGKECLKKPSSESEMSTVKSRMQGNVLGYYALGATMPARLFRDFSPLYLWL